MSFNLIDSVSNLLGGDFVGKASSMLGETEGNVQKAISGIIPTALTGLLSRATSSGGASDILAMAKDAVGSGVLSNITNGLGMSTLLDKGSHMLKWLFGDRLSDVTNMISNYSGIRSSSATSLMSVALPATLASLGRHADSTNMNASGLLGFLNSQKDHILNAIPSGLNIAGALGLGSLATLRNKFTGLSSSLKDAPAKGNRWLVPVILILLALLAIWYFMSKKKEPEVAAATVTTDTVAVAPAPAVAHESIKVKLPDGTELDAYKGGIEDQLVAFLSDPAAKVDKNIWFDFDALNFETGSAKITAESGRQIANIAAIMKAFPNAAIKIGGYTDKTGDSVGNLKLSQARADAVSDALKTTGTPATQLAGAEGYGSQFAKADATAPDAERMKDRHISVSVRKK